MLDIKQEPYWMQVISKDIFTTSDLPGSPVRSFSVPQNMKYIWVFRTHYSSSKPTVKQHITCDISWTFRARVGRVGRGGGGVSAGMGLLMPHACHSVPKWACHDIPPPPGNVVRVSDDSSNCWVSFWRSWVLEARGRKVDMSDSRLSPSFYCWGLRANGDCV